MLDQTPPRMVQEDVQDTVKLDDLSDLQEHLQQAREPRSSVPTSLAHSPTLVQRFSLDNAEGLSRAATLPLQARLRRSAAGGSSSSLQNLAPLELGERLQHRAALRQKLSHVLGRSLLLAMIYLVARELFEGSMVPGGALWSLLLVWVCSYHAGEAFERLGAPKALGMLVSGLVLRSLPAAHNLALPLAHLNSGWSKDIRAGAMALVLLRAGLGLDWETVAAYGTCLPAMAILPSLMESTIGAAVASKIFSMPYELAWVMSFMVSAVGPAIIASGCSAAKEKGFAPAAPNFLMTCAVFDDSTCIIGFNCIMHAILVTGGDVGWQYAIGPMNLVLGVAGGIFAAATMSATAMFPGTGPRTWTLFSVCMMLIFVAEKNQLLGAGAIANLVFGLGVRHAWRRGWPGKWALAPEHADDPAAAASKMLKDDLAGLYRVWNIAFYPLLFGLIGASLDARDADPAIGRAAVGYAFFTVGVRLFVTLLVTNVLPPFRQRFTPGERAFMALAWISKATTQAAFATVPALQLDMWVSANPGKTWRGHTAADLARFGHQIQWCCVLSIFIGTPFGTIVMNNGAPHLLGCADAAEPTAGGDAHGPGTTSIHASDATVVNLSAADVASTILVAAGNGHETVVKHA